MALTPDQKRSMMIDCYKKQYNTRRRAEGAILKTETFDNRELNPNRVMNAYICRRCGWWHIGHIDR
jgi:hypothetical protein